MGEFTTAEFFSYLKDTTEQTYELARTTQQAGKKKAMIGAVGVDADYHIQDQQTYLRMIAFVRMMERNSPVISSAARRLVSNVNVGQMTPVPATGSKDLDEHIKGIWKEYSTDPDLCDATQRFNFEQMADIAFIRSVFDGDLIATPKSDGSILNLEGHRCQTPWRSQLDRGVCGVKMHEDGLTISDYFLTKKSFRYGHSVLVDEVKPVKRKTETGWRNVFHVFRPERFSLNRGVTSLAPVATTESRRDDAEFAQLVKLQIASCVTFTETISDLQMIKELLAAGVSLDQSNSPTTFTQKDDAGYEMRTAAIHPGRVLESRPGRKLEMNTPNIPGDGALELNRNLLMYLSMTMDIPLIVLLLDARDANFSSYRNVLDQARIHFERHQRNFASMYSRHIYRNLLRVRAKKDKMLSDFVKSNRMEDMRDVVVKDGHPVSLLSHAWVSPGWKYQHPVDDAMGDVILLSNSMLDIDRYARRRYGISGEELTDSVIRGREHAILSAVKASDRIRAATVTDWRPDGVDVPWQYLWQPQNAAGIQVQMPEGSDESVVESRQEDPKKISDRQK